MQAIADWLEKLGMSGSTRSALPRTSIDVSVLPHLTDQDLKDLGVLLGHRRKMLAAIADPVCALQAPPQPALDRAEAPRHCRATTSHGAVLGPRWFDCAGRSYGPGGPSRGHFRPIRSASAETVQRFGGFVAKYHG